jgi:hypothetical protein
VNSDPERPSVHLPAHWSPQQAMAVHDALDAVLAALWTQYETALLEQADSDRHDPAAPTQPDLFDDDLPF